MSRGNVIKYERIGEKGKKGKGNPKKEGEARSLRTKEQGKGVE